MKSRTIIRTKTGLELHALGELNWSLEWDEVTGVVAYKSDLHIVDQVCFGFRILDDQQHYFIIDEDTPGFKSIEDDLSKRTEGAWLDKFLEVTSPAFELCWTELWVAPGTPSLTNNPYLHKIAPESESDF